MKSITKEAKQIEDLTLLEHHLNHILIVDKERNLDFIRTIRKIITEAPVLKDIYDLLYLVDIQCSGASSSEKTQSVFTLLLSNGIKFTFKYGPSNTSAKNLWSISSSIFDTYDYYTYMFVDATFEKIYKYFSKKRILLHFKSPLLSTINIFPSLPFDSVLKHLDRIEKFLDNGEYLKNKKF